MAVNIFIVGQQGEIVQKVNPTISFLSAVIVITVVLFFMLEMILETYF